MEASVAAQGGEGQAQGEGQGQSSDQQFATVDQFQEMQAAQQEMLDMLRSGQLQASQQDPAAQEPEAEQVPDLDLSFLDDAGYDPQEAAERLSGALDQRVQAAIQQATEPLQQQIREQQYEREAEALVAELPELSKPEVQQQVLGLARDLIEANNWPKELLHDPRFWRMSYLTAKAAETANAEGSEQPAAAHLEGGGGATPASAQVDHAQAIADVGREGRAAFPWL